MSALDASIKSNQYQFYGLVTLRFLIGWHFLYEGISKLLNPYWSSAAYLLDSKWIFSGLANTIVSNPNLLTISDYINMWGLTLVGVSLIFGIYSRYGSLIGMGFIMLYYLFAPPLVGLEYGKPNEGSYIIVNKNLIEACALWVLYSFPTSQHIGLDRFLQAKGKN
ncbi:MAG: DoxX subfamily [Candidatus Marinimicrobia bacterium]|jgi:thiosulfate dehydrogenase [quinone] large subunit|nr:DoxX subfamily [Candidatus Neomarinimicrobiota bacterium]MBO70101.1 DoxX subfamily [Candidatus Neomarinimicrobiota bacterium]MBO70369.1 DoxX subfamily [Candidatus Neomarinimicrobiota bacterium]MEC8703728.1 DoxX family membrane protein [Candidatus Neomarinimicrobiota bacterium]|tara:strand:+ start:95 stop:589 length:495 start_codon:yes stop_codon:yes gene_type:complete